MALRVPDRCDMNSAKQKDTSWLESRLRVFAAATEIETTYRLNWPNSISITTIYSFTAKTNLNQILLRIFVFQTVLNASHALEKIKKKNFFKFNLNQAEKNY